MVYCHDCVFWVAARDADDDGPRGRICFRSWRPVTRRAAEQERECRYYLSHLEACASLVYGEYHPAGGAAGGTDVPP